MDWIAIGAISTIGSLVILVISFYYIYQERKKKDDGSGKIKLGFIECNICHGTGKCYTCKGLGKKLKEQ